MPTIFYVSDLLHFTSQLSFPLKKKNNRNEEFSYGSNDPSVNFKGSIFLHHIFLSGECYNPIAAQLYPPLAETDTCGGIPLEQQGPVVAEPRKIFVSPCGTFNLSTSHRYSVVIMSL